MTSFGKVFGGRLVLSVALGACACQHDSVAKFDDLELPDPATGGTSGAAGSLASAGESAAGGEDTSAAGSSTAAGTTGSAGKGGSGKGGAGGMAPTAGSAGKPSTAGGGGSGGSVAGGGAGGKEPDPDPEPEPVTVTTEDFADAYVASCMNLNFGEAQTLNVDAGNSCIYQALMNPSLADVPDGAVVSAATLTLHCVNVGDALTVSYVEDAWKEDTVRWSTRPEAGTKLADLSCTEMGDVTLDLTAAVKAWLGGTHAANGFRISTEGEDGTDFTSSESIDVGERPSLSVTYTLPVK